MRPNDSFVGQPVRSLQTMLRVVAKDDAHLPSVIPDGYYGPTTMHAVTAFQRQYGLPVTGVTDQQTWEKVVDVYEAALIRVGKAESIEINIDPGKAFILGESNPYIYLIQAILTQLSQHNVKISAPNQTGILDKQTSDAVASFQYISGLPVTGEVDRITWKHLAKHFSLSASHYNNIL